MRDAKEEDDLIRVVAGADVEAIVLEFDLDLSFDGGFVLFLHLSVIPPKDVDLLLI